MATCTERPSASSKLPIREGEANMIAHLDGRCVKVHVTTVRNFLNRNTLILIANPYEFNLTRTLYHSDRSLEHKLRRRDGCYVPKFTSKGL